MKKLIALCTSIVSAFTLATSLTANAEEYATPVFYLQADSSQNIEVDGSTVTISREALEGADFSLNIDIFVQDTDLKSWRVSPKWKCASEYIKLNEENVFLPSKDNPEFAYGITNDKGNLVYSVAKGGDTNYNTLFFTCQPQITASDRSALKPLGDTSDAYPLTSFDAVISSDIPDGVYEIYFLKNPEDYDDQQVSEGAFRMSDGSAKSYKPIVKNLTIIVGDPLGNHMLGDVNSDNLIDARDASLVLMQYAAESLDSANVIDAQQRFIANVNNDTAVDARDASIILSYYAYCSLTENPVTLPEYIQMN